MSENLERITEKSIKGVKEIGGAKVKDLVCFYMGEPVYLNLDVGEVEGYCILNQQSCSHMSPIPEHPIYKGCPVYEANK